jgi:hypothetical protein
MTHLCHHANFPCGVCCGGDTVAENSDHCRRNCSRGKSFVVAIDSLTKQIDGGNTNLLSVAVSVFVADDPTWQPFSRLLFFVVLVVLLQIDNGNINVAVCCPVGAAPITPLEIDGTCWRGLVCWRSAAADQCGLSRWQRFVVADDLSHLDGSNRDVAIDRRVLTMAIFVIAVMAEMVILCIVNRVQQNDWPKSVTQQ